MKKKRRMKKRPVERVVKKEQVVDGKVDDVHSPAVECHVHIEEFVGPIDAVRELKTFEQPADGFRQVVVPNLLQSDLFDLKRGDHGQRLHQKLEDQVLKKFDGREGCRWQKCGWTN